MRIAMIGLGKMGSNMTTRLLNGGHEGASGARHPLPRRRHERRRVGTDGRI